MPHLTIEYSDNLVDKATMGELCRDLARCVDSQYDGGKKVFPTGGIRVRAYTSDTCFIADGSVEDAAFIHLNLRIGAGRSDEVVKRARAELMDVVKRRFVGRDSKRGLAISFEVNEFNRFGTLKQNDLRELLAERTSGGTRGA